MATVAGEEAVMKSVEVHRAADGRPHLTWRVLDAAGQLPVSPAPPRECVTNKKNNNKKK